MAKGNSQKPANGSNLDFEAQLSPVGVAVLSSQWQHVLGHYFIMNFLTCRTETVQNDLWRWPKARAAVMVGAGLSLNSEPLPGVHSSFPLGGS